MASEISTPGIPLETVAVGMAELICAPELVAIEYVVSDSPWEKLGVDLGIVELVSAGWVANETAVVGFSGEEVGRVGIAELLSFSEWVTHEAVVSSSCRESARVEKVVLVSTPELVTVKVGNSDMPGEIVVADSELTSAPGGVAVESVVSDSLWEKFGVILETGVLVSEEWVTHKAVSDSCE